MPFQIYTYFENISMIGKIMSNPTHNPLFPAIFLCAQILLNLYSFLQCPEKVGYHVINMLVI